MIAAATYFQKNATNERSKHFIYVSASVANPNSRIFFPRLKGRVEKELVDLGFQKLSIFRPTFIVRTSEDRRVEKWIVRALEIYESTRIAITKGYRRSVLEKGALSSAMWKCALEPFGQETNGICIKQIWGSKTRDHNIVRIYNSEDIHNFQLVG